MLVPSPSGLRPRIIRLAEELGYTHRSLGGSIGTEIFKRDGREVEVQFTRSLTRIVRLYVDNVRIQPAGKWPTIAALRHPLPLPGTLVGGEVQTEEGIKS